MSVSFWQILIVVLVLLILFGPSRIPSLGRSLGEAIRGFKKGLDEEGRKEGETKSTSTGSSFSHQDSEEKKESSLTDNSQH